MGDTSIRVSEETKRRLDLRQRRGESHDDVLRRLASQDRWAGFGALADAEPETGTLLEWLREEIREDLYGDRPEILGEDGGDGGPA